MAKSRPVTSAPVNVPVQCFYNWDVFRPERFRNWARSATEVQTDRLVGTDPTTCKQILKSTEALNWVSSEHAESAKLIGMWTWKPLN